jgi:uncharacterized membrane protein
MSEVPSLSLRSWFSRGWGTFKRSPKEMIGGAAIFSVFFLAFGSLIDFLPGGLLVDLFQLIVLLLVGPVLTVGWNFLCLRLVRGDGAKTSDLFSSFSRFGAVWATSVLVFLIVLGGTILLLIPGIIWFLRYSLSLLALMDRRFSVREAMRFSGRITKGHKGRLFIAGLVAFLLSVLLTLPLSFGLGLLENEALASIYVEIGILPSEDLGPAIVAVGIVPYLVHALVVVPWISATFAAAYEGLASNYKEDTGPRGES